MKTRTTRIGVAALTVSLLVAPAMPAAHAAAPTRVPASISAGAPAKDPVIPPEYQDIFDAAYKRYMSKYTAEVARLQAAGAKARAAALVAERTRLNAGADLNAAIALEKEWKLKNPSSPLPDSYRPTVSQAQATYKKANAAAVKAVNAAFTALTAARKRSQQVVASAKIYAYEAVKESIPDPDV